MDRGLAVVLTAAVGGLVALQAPINSGLGKSLGTFQAATISFFVGLLLLTIIALTAGGGLGDLGEVRHVSWYYLLGGVLGACYVSAVLVTVRTLGVGGVTAATIAGQLSVAVVIDQLGVLGVTKQPITALRLLGVAFLTLGTYLVLRD